MKIKRLLFLFSLPLLLAACTSYKNVPYLQNPEAVNDLEGTLPLYDAKIMPKDLLSITVNTTTQPTLQQYLVNNSGEIDFPVIGTLRVGGLTKNEAESLIRERLRPYLKEAPIVTVRMANYKISVLGEVARPGSFTIGNEKVNVLEALAMAGDMTIYGVRDNVKLIREDESGKRGIINLDLNNAGIVTSPYYYLKQNDILYVTPNETKARNSDIGNSTTLWVSSISILVSIAGLLVNILK